MEDNFVSLVKSYIASEEKLRNASTLLLKKKLQKANDDIYQLELELVERENFLLAEIERVKMDSKKKLVAAVTLAVGLTIVVATLVAFYVAL